MAYNGKNGRISGEPMRIYCSRCGQKAIIRTSKQLGGTRKLYCLCGDPQCGHSFVMDLSFSHTISPSALDLPEKVRAGLQQQSPGQILSLFAVLG